jgi:energy-coupling factor transport system ATP-binding protein
VGFVVAGFGPVLMVALGSVVGALVGGLKRRGRGKLWLLAASAVIAPSLGALTVVALWVFVSARRLALDQVEIQTRGFSSLLARLGLGSVGTWLNHTVAVLIGHWWLTVGLFVAVCVVGVIVMAWVSLGAVLNQLAWVSTTDRLATAGLLEDGAGSVAPLPVQLLDACYRYPGADRDAIRDIELTISAGEFIVFAGKNGSGKSTLARLLAGVAPTAGAIRRPGSVGLGAPGGVAIVAQRPESQILGTRVDDDVTWGLHSSEHPGIAELLVSVGLEGMEGRDTSTLSGGELQRLAVAGALAHRPALLISDESTAMIDPAGRDALMSLLTSLPERFSTAVVHVSHRAAEVALADRVIHLAAGVQSDLSNGNGTPDVPTPVDQMPVQVRDDRREPKPEGSSEASARVVLRAAGLRHTYSEGTPWAQPALRGIDLEIGEGDAVLVTGGNGSGKTTLAWALAGLLRPTAGICEVDGRPVSGQVGKVAMSFQHARLQLLRPTVLADVRAASGADRGTAEAALELVGLDPERFGASAIEQLSGGQLRRASLAGLLARHPRVLVLDEPFAGLDDEGRVGMVGLLERLRRQEGRTLVVISHDLEGLTGVCPRTIELADGLVVTGRSSPVRLGDLRVH